MFTAFNFFAIVAIMRWPICRLTWTCKSINVAAFDEWWLNNIRAGRVNLIVYNSSLIGIYYRPLPVDSLKLHQPTHIHCEFRSKFTKFIKSLTVCDSQLTYSACYGTMATNCIWEKWYQIKKKTHRNEISWKSNSITNLKSNKIETDRT